LLSSHSNECATIGRPLLGNAWVDTADISKGGPFRAYVGSSEFGYNALQNCIFGLLDFIIFCIVKVKLSLYQAVKAHKVVRR
jgi:hypothetical protein